MQCLSDGFKLRPFGDLPLLEVAPQGNGQAPSQRHNADPPHALAPGGEAFGKPLAQFALRLIAQPAQASSTISARTRRLPALEMPCSVWLCPLA